MRLAKENWEMNELFYMEFLNKFKQELGMRPEMYSVLIKHCMRCTCHEGLNLSNPVS